MAAAKLAKAADSVTRKLVFKVQPSGYKSRTWPPELLQTIHEKAQEPTHPVTLSQMLNFGRNINSQTLLHSALFLHKELPIRLAQRVRELDSLPFRLNEMPSVLKVRDLYIGSTDELLNFPPPTDAEHNDQFVDLLTNIKNRHSLVVPTIARGVIELKNALGDRKIHELNEVQGFLDRFYMSRIGIRCLIGHHLSLYDDIVEKSSQRVHVGSILLNCNPKEVSETAYEDARLLCEQQYGTAPIVHYLGDLDATFPFQEAHLRHMLFELLKNSMRAVVETHGEHATLPPIKVVIAKGQKDVTIKLSDEGGGIPREHINDIWTYLYTTASSPVDFGEGDGTPYSEFTAPMAGFGYGLPLCRLYARYYGGDLQIISMDGYGTDAYIYLYHLGDSPEPLP
mmetsp:Transcript_7037/g.17812  ORF Transcript_7037/g.17812 Transcript_7037/m.17812 type:complete len:396 (+) Transcript_7037:262-1449(+)